MRRANVSTRRTNVPSGAAIFQTFLLRNVKGNFYALLLYKKIQHFTWYHSISYVYVLYIKIVLYFISILHVISRKSARNFSFLIFSSFWPFSYKWKYKKTWFLCVTSSKGFLKFFTAKTTTQGKEYMWILWSSWIVICLSWRSQIVISNLIVTMFLFVSSDHVFEYCSV